VIGRHSVQGSLLFDVFIIKLLAFFSDNLILIHPIMIGMIEPSSNFRFEYDRVDPIFFIDMIV